MPNDKKPGTEKQDRPMRQKRKGAGKNEQGSGGGRNQGR
jgi:hypothetical protein